MSRVQHIHDVVIVGAGAAGIGSAMALREVGAELLILERNTVGASFKLWPQEMRFITPSFPGNQFGAIDLNAICPHSSPALAFGCEHPSGAQYASYLRATVDDCGLPVREGEEVQAVITPKQQDEPFQIRTQRGHYRARQLVWAAGEFQYPNPGGFPGAQWCCHNTCIRSFAALPEADYLVIGGYESGIDAALHLSRAGKKVTVLDEIPHWERQNIDPSRALSPYTRERLAQELPQGRITLIGKVRVTAVTQRKQGFRVHAGRWKHWDCLTPPILANGFSGSLGSVETLFARAADGRILLTDHDESTLCPGLFLSGPMLRHREAIFCFVYKFRQRFPVVASRIAQRLDKDSSALSDYQKNHMWLSDLACCDEACEC